MREAKGQPTFAPSAGVVFPAGVVPGLTIFLGAFLLFLIQPLIGKYLLPWFGGGPGVWTVCLLFFQCALLGGYAYAHLLTTRASPRRQAVVHGALVLASLCFLPVIPGAAWRPVDGSAPTVRLLLVLSATIGVPYVALAATGPLVQRWAAAAAGGAAPYRLFALSNAGSLLALAAYPFALEPYFSRRAQAWLWSAGLLVFVGLCVVCAWQRGRTSETAGTEEFGPAEGGRVTRAQIGWWLALPATASLLLAAVTNKLTLDVAPVPLLWLLPLAVYLLSFIFSFGSRRGYSRPVFAVLFAAGCVAIGVTQHTGTDVSLTVQAAVYGAVLFVACAVCHGEVHRLRPGAPQLTSFYLCLAAGGATGCLFVAVVAPQVFDDYRELEIGLGATAALLGALVLAKGRSRWARSGLSVGVGVVVMAGLWLSRPVLRERVLASSRNFYGTLRVTEIESDDRSEALRVLRHGTTPHGMQFRSPARASWPTSYYGHTSGAGVVLEHLKTAPGRKVGVVGLGAGTLAAYGRAGDAFTFFEIDPAVVEVAERQFSFLRTSAANIEIVRGDARLALEASASGERERRFDVLLLDAFSGDAVPMHLLTAEAMAIYAAHMKPDGVIAVHISNRYLDLRGVVAGLAERADMRFLVVFDEPKPEEVWLKGSVWCLLSRDPEVIPYPVPQADSRGDAGKKAGQVEPVSWTDDQASVLAALR